MIERVSLDTWLAFDAEHPAPTFFARPAWALALADVYPNAAPSLLRIRSRRGPAILLPVMEVRGGPLRLRRLNAFPLGGYTCFMHEDGTLATIDEVERSLDELARFAHSATVVPWPLGPVPANRNGIAHETAVVDLSNGIDAALANVDGTYRRMAGQAARRGVTCETASGHDAVETYYALLRESANRWGIPEPTERRPLIEALVKYGGSDVEIWFARVDGSAIAGGVVFYGASEFFFWSAAMLTEFGRLRPSNALNYALLHAAARRGMQWYNLGSSEGLPGVARFKRDLGARDVPYRELHFEQTPIRAIRTVRRALAFNGGA
jgi:CelD/BcsL family acetyltransferase involved in cellulose biosynthesis